MFPREPSVYEMQWAFLLLGIAVLICGALVAFALSRLAWLEAEMKKRDATKGE